MMVDPTYFLLLGILSLSDVQLLHGHTCYLGSEFTDQHRRAIRWVLPYQDPCWCTSVRLGGHNVTSSRGQQLSNRATGLFFSDDPGKIRSHFGCPAPCDEAVKLGVEDGSIPDDNITASSNWSGFPPFCGRLNNTSTWVSATDDLNQWIQVDLGRATQVSGVLMQGNPRGQYQYVTKYLVKYETFPPQGYMAYVRDLNGNIREFDGNARLDYQTSNGSWSMFDRPIATTKVRILPVKWEGHICLRFELLGCKQEPKWVLYENL